MNEQSERHGGADRTDHVSDIIRKAQERLDHGRLMEDARLRLADGYVDIPLWIAMEFEIERSDFKFLACLCSERHFIERKAAGTERSDNARNGRDGNQKAVFVRVGKLVQCGESWVPSVIGFYLIHNDVLERLGYGPLFVSLLNGRYYTLPCIPNWEENLTGLFRFTQCGRVRMVESGSEVCDRISKDEIDGRINGLADELERPEPSFRIRFNMDGSFGFDKIESVPFKIIDVMYGPLNLQPSR